MEEKLSKVKEAVIKDGADAGCKLIEYGYGEKSNKTCSDSDYRIVVAQHKDALRITRKNNGNIQVIEAGKK